MGSNRHDLFLVGLMDRMEANFRVKSVNFHRGNGFPITNDFMGVNFNPTLCKHQCRAMPDSISHLLCGLDRRCAGDIGRTGGIGTFIKRCEVRVENKR